MKNFDYINRKNTYGELEYQYHYSNRPRTNGYYYDADGKLHVEGLEGLRAYKRDMGIY